MNTKTWSIALVSSTIAVVASVSPARSETVEVTVNDLLVRSGPGTNYSIITAWNRGVQASRIKQSGNWSYVVTGRVEGWVFTPYIKSVASSGGSVLPQPTYQRSGTIENARYTGSGQAEVKINGNNATVLFASPRGIANSFSTVYYGSIYSNSGSLIRVSLNKFESLRTNGSLPTTGECQLSLSGNTLTSATCRASGFDHGRTVFSGR